ncbi:hypothetical protein C2845_PM04G03750 [Panicum miliaceum]|uniref:Uncharacterized protein n=1 Tax=Panicum miliaceum TaxID=4540 RepID=A0A3L6QNG7_PANMI|nr:hypothetical protein C2845_PM04G03750 [Panicum miliaceum]
MQPRGRKGESSSVPDGAIHAAAAAKRSAGDLRAAGDRLHRELYGPHRRFVLPLVWVPHLARHADNGLWASARQDTGAARQGPMKFVAAYLLVVLAGNPSSSTEDLSAILESESYLEELLSRNMVEANHFNYNKMEPLVQGTRHTSGGYGIQVPGV